MTDAEFGGPLVLASVPKEQVEDKIRWMINAWKDGNALVRQSFPTESEAEAADLIREYHLNQLLDPIYINNKYQVQVREVEKADPAASGMVWLSIKRIDRNPLHDWRAIQEIKNRLVGPECEAIEIYPAESRRVDTANQYHLWCFKDPNYRIPIGFNSGRHVDDESIGGSVNRPVKKGEDERR